MLIVLEGLDGSGTTSHAKRLATKHGGHYLPQPSTGPIGSFTRELFTGKRGPMPGPLVMAHLFQADRLQQLPELELLLATDKPVFCDRYWYSGCAYQPRYSQTIRNWCADLPEPDLVLWLDVEPEEGLRRLKGDPDAFEHIEILQRARATYAEFWVEDDLRWQRINSHAPRRAVEAEIDQCIAAVIPA